MMSLFSPLRSRQVFSPLLNQILNAHTASESQNIANSLAKQISDMFLGKFEAIFLSNISSLFEGIWKPESMR